ncbi:cytochrome-c peroxidase [Pontibacter harenae]|uniref:cytochrome-c peroxidase n=1 Tax=Pontibacter harenae TaxID=2894083 RepID=UPI001E377BE5|nr:cytochrome c peroxidase [Pontibacter harenae]MCC9167537.1 c-type cytochrome [Pontibacter harenae]
MKKNVMALVAFLAIVMFCCTQQVQQKPAPKAKAYLLANLDTLQTTATDRLLRQAINGPVDSIQAAFLATRLAYKKVELFTEYYTPTASKEMNGAPLPEIETDETTSFDPSGLQVIEEKIFPEFEEENRDELVREVRKFISVSGRARTLLQHTTFSDANIFAACKQEIFRVIVLGITNFDTPITATGVKESVAALRSVQAVLHFYGENTKIQQLLQNAIAYTSHSNDPDSFDRMAFILNFANPITSELVRWEEELEIEPLETQSVLNTKALTLFDEGALNPNFFAGSSEAMATPTKAALGKALFFDPVVAGGTRTCGSCHKPELAFTDGLPKSIAIEEGKFVQRNAPTLFYAGLQHAQFYDMRASTLESQAVDVIHNKDEMHGSVEEAAQRLNQQPVYLQAFKEAFPELDTQVQPKHVMIALASYVRSLTPFNSRFDKHMRGTEELLTEEEIKGFNLFTGKAKCATCHFIPVFNGTAAPAFNNTEAEVLGVLQDPRATTPTLDIDEGRYTHSKMEELRFAFKTPTLRNIAKTAPYMHNGAYETLEEVMDFYNKGGAMGMGLHLENQTLPPDPLNLTEEETKAVIAFLNSLTDEVN